LITEIATAKEALKDLQEEKSKSSESGHDFDVDAPVDPNDSDANAARATAKKTLKDLLEEQVKLLKDEDAAAKKYHEKRTELRDGAECKEFVSRIAELRETEKNAVHKCHSASQAFLSTYSTILYPKFSVDERMVSKGGSGGLAKNWKGPGARQAHGAHRSRVVRKLGLLGKVAVNVSEACSTMMCPFCRTLSSPGTHYLHHCSNPKCKRVSFRDECGRGISVLAATRALRSKTSLTDVTVNPCQAVGGSSIAVS